MTRPVQALARLISILGHPAFLSPITVLVVLAYSDSSLLRPATVTLISVASVIMLYSYWKVRTGKWRHVDASIPDERRSLNPVLASIFGLGALLVAQIPGAKGLNLGLLLGGFIPIIAILFSRWVKLSQHVAFAGFMAMWLWSVAPWLSYAGFVIAALIAWSRIELRRHTGPDVCVGIIVGAGVGGAFLLLLHLVLV